MDVNGTRFHLVSTRTDWFGDAAPPSGAGVEWARDETMTLASQPFVFPPRPAEPRLTRENRRGAARDRFGTWYWISDDERGLLQLAEDWREPRHFQPGEAEASSEPETIGRFRACPPPAPSDWVLRGLAVTSDHHLVVGVARPAPGLLVFDLYTGGAPERMQWPASVAFDPFDIAAIPGGGLWILDSTARRLWRLDEHLRVCAPRTSTTNASSPDFRPREPTSLSRVDAGHAIGSITADMALPLERPHAPIAVEALPDGSALVLDDDPALSSATVTRYGATIARMTLREAGGRQEVLERLARGHDLAFAATTGGADRANRGLLFVVGPDGNQSFAFTLELHGDALTLGLVPSFHPMRRHGGRALVAAGDGIFYDFSRRWVPLGEQPRVAYAPVGEVRLPSRDLRPPSTRPLGAEADEPRDEWAFDGREPGCVWHRLFVDGCIPPGTSVMVESRAADAREDLPQTAWQTEPAPYLRSSGAEIPFYAPPVSPGTAGAGTWELLFQRARGRFLQLRLRLRGSDASRSRSTPRLRALRVYYPRFSYLREYLPAVYREDESSASFLDRYLANVEGLYTTLEDRIARVQEYFDPWNTPAEYLAWLGGWMGAVPDLAWSERTQRAFVAHAPRLFRERGTRPGMIRALRLALDPCADESVFTGPAEDSGSAFGVRVVERYLSRRAPGVVFGDPTDLLGPGSTVNADDWTPAEGSLALHQRFRNFLGARYDDIEALNAAWFTSYRDFDDERLQLFAIQPAHATTAGDWRHFVTAELGFTYAAVTAADAKHFQRFLAARHRQIDRLNRAYGLTGGGAYPSFAAVPLPGVVPARGASLQDWIMFVSSVLPRRRGAHRFSVLVPVRLDDDLETQRRRLALAHRIASVERPAHTAFDVRLYWGAFRVGEARTGIDTVLGESSRFAALVLGRGVVGESYLGHARPWDATDRRVVGRDHVNERPVRAAPPARMT